MVDVRVSHMLDLSDEDRQLLSRFLPTDLQTTFEGDLRQFPRRVWIFTGGGGYGESVLAALALAILGGGALIVLKAFLGSIGSELGKEFVKRWKPRTTEAAGRSEPGLIVLCELHPKLIAIVRLDSSALEQYHSAELLEKNADGLPSPYASGPPRPSLLPSKIGPESSASMERGARSSESHAPWSQTRNAFSYPCGPLLKDYGGCQCISPDCLQFLLLFASA